MADSQRKTANLFDISTIINGVIDQKGDIVATGSSYRTSDYIPVSSGNYTISLIMNIDTARRIFVALYDNNKTFTNRLESSELTNAGFKTYTFSNTANYIRICFVNTDTNIMLNSGSTALPYEPYGWQHSLRKLGTSTDTITTLPADLYADGQSATVGLVGNMEQSGTPSPNNPIQPQETGERTGNLFDKSTWNSVSAQRGTIEVVTNGFKLTATSNDAYTNTYGSANPQCSYRVVEGETYTLSWEVDDTNISGVVYIFTGTTTGGTVLINTDASQKKASFTIPSGHNYVAFRLGVSTSGDSITYTNIMLNTGSTALPYEPFGVKIPISSAGQITPVYLGEAQTTRKIKKLVLTGQETWTSESTMFYCYISDAIIENYYPLLCSHYKYGSSYNEVQTIDNTITISTRILLHDSACANASALKTYLQQQYAAGTPVTIWYVLTNETTGIVNEPLRKIGDYADTVSGITIPTITGKDTFDVQTTLKPSEVSLAYTGWHNAEVKEWDGSEWQ